MHYSFSLTLPLLLLCFPFLSISFPNQQQNLQPNSMDPSELEILFKIMDSMSSDQSWRISYPNPCKPGSSWMGIECKAGNDSHLHVTRLDFGSPPNPSCKIKSIFPSQIFHLPYLQSAIFSQCFTHTKTTLTISQNNFFNSKLQQLSLRSNPALIGSIPPQLYTLNSLQTLTLSQNRLTGPIPKEICSLTSLQHLDLSYNFLSGIIPKQLGNLKNLVVLDLSYNSLTKLIPDTIGQMGMLQKLDLSSNLLTGSLPNSIEKLNSLVFMALSNNRLKGKNPKGLVKLQSLQYLIMDDNPMFIPLPAEFGQLHKLQELRLANSGYSGTIPPIYSQLLNLSTLSLQNNRIIGVIPAGFGNLSHIYHLNLSRNLLGGEVPFTSTFFQRLGKNLDLSGNSGLCLSPAEAYGVKKIGVDICGINKTASLIKPLKHSEAPSLGFTKLFFLFNVFFLLCLH
ncbi:uncharacterized protein LOC141698005 [Apium graveolens]|uniref:uncharacterized protein LOC141698005 n=1 Tax=Apium graveolens TaxID=4045 RepID=UPI003D7A9B14